MIRDCIKCGHRNGARVTAIAAMLCGTVVASPSAHAQTVVKCRDAATGAVTYVNGQCPAQTDRAPLNLVVPSPPDPSPPASHPLRRLPDPSPATKPSPAADPGPGAIGVRPKSWIEIEADQCLEWYRPMLRDPRGAYWRDASRDRSTLSIQIYATNGFGGYVATPARCEFLRGGLDDDWTRTRARALNWPVR